MHGEAGDAQLCSPVDFCFGSFLMETRNPFPNPFIFELSQETIQSEATPKLPPTLFNQAEPKPNENQTKDTPFFGETTKNQTVLVLARTLANSSPPCARAPFGSNPWTLLATRTSRQSQPKATRYSCNTISKPYQKKLRKNTASPKQKIIPQKSINPSPALVLPVLPDCGRSPGASCCWSLQKTVSVVDALCQVVWGICLKPPELLLV